MIARAVLDYVGLPVNVPGNLEARLRRVHFRKDGSVIDDGSRSGATQAGCHRFVAERGQNIPRVAAPSIAALAEEGYSAPDLGLLRLIAQHEWRHATVTARRGRLRIERPELRLVVRALGVDIVGAGQIAIGLGLATVTRKGATLTAKSEIRLLPGDPLDLAFEVLGGLAERIGYQPLCIEDRSLVQAVAAYLWTPDAITARKDVWVDFRERLTIPDFIPVPTGSTLAPAFHRSQN